MTYWRLYSYFSGCGGGGFIGSVRTINGEIVSVSFGLSGYPELEAARIEHEVIGSQEEGDLAEN